MKKRTNNFKELGNLIADLDRQLLDRRISRSEYRTELERVKRRVVNDMMEGKKPDNRSLFFDVILN